MKTAVALVAVVVVVTAVALVAVVVTVTAVAVGAVVAVAGVAVGENSGRKGKKRKGGRLCLKHGSSSNR